MNGTYQHIHLLGICGAGMGALAKLLVEQGYKVSGSDSNSYPPMSETLENLGIHVYKNYSANNLNAKPDLVVIGNVIRKDNPEASAVLQQGITYRSMPQVLAELFLAKRTPLVVTGTHGKTTTATMLSWMLSAASENPGFFIGGIGQNLKSNAQTGSGKYFVIEGDEYDTAFFDKAAKFMHYCPQGLIITSIEYDHADIFQSLDDIMLSFAKLISSMPENGVIVANYDDENVRKLCKQAKCKVISYSTEGNEASYQAKILSSDKAGSQFQLKTPQNKLTFDVPFHGEHNIANATACLALLIEQGINADKLFEGLKTFAGVKRRLELVGEHRQVTILDDFAHHPTAVKKTLAAVRSRYPDCRLWAIFEPRSNTSRRDIFRKEYTKALMGADRVVISGVYKANDIPASERLDVQKLADTLIRRGPDAHYIDDLEMIPEFIVRNIAPNDVVLFMSNGTFGGLPQKTFAALNRRKLYLDEAAIPMGRVPKQKTAG